MRTDTVMVALAGALSLFGIPLSLTLLLLIAGALMMWLAHCPEPRMTWRSWVVLLAGCVVLLGVLGLFGQERIRHWTPHPAGYVPAWFVVFHAVRQIPSLFARYEPETA